jgi:hypothetical protein
VEGGGVSLPRKERENKMNELGQKKFAVVYYSGQSVTVHGESLEQVKERESALVENWKRINKNPNLGIADIWEIKK